VLDIEMNQVVKDLNVRHAHPCLPLYKISYIVYALGYFHGYALSHERRRGSSACYLLGLGTSKSLVNLLA
jgi:hypothetical protein